MSFRVVPDRMAGYVTWELADKLANLRPQQREAIDRIVEHVYLQNGAWADLFRGDDPICTEANYYKRGHLDEATGEWRKVGWAHDPAFQDALTHAVKLALTSKQRERLGWQQRAKMRAESAAEDMVNVWVRVANTSELDFAKIQAAEKVLDLAFKGSDGQSDMGASVEADWWSAAGE